MNIAGLILLFVVLVFTPWMVAVIRDHRQKAAIFALCLFLGWTFLFWVLALVWALMKDREAPNPFSVQ